MDRRFRLARRSLPAVLAVTLLVALAAAFRAPSRVVAIADVHGAYPELVAILQRTQLINTSRRWIGGSDTLVQTGDVIDRGARSRETLDLLMALERQAARQGGAVIPLLGNHEVMNMMGDVRYVTPEIYRTFATAGSERRRERAQADYVRFLAEHRGHEHTAVAPADKESRAKWMEEHPSGYFEYREAFGPTGRYGRWIRTHHAVVQLGDGVFVHGGLSPSLDFGIVRELDDRMIGEIAAYDSIWRALVDRKVVWRYMTLTEAVKFVREELKWSQASGDASKREAEVAMQRLLDNRNWLIVAAGGPLWYRGLADAREDSLIVGVKEMLNRLQVKYIVVGHSVISKTEITTRFQDRVYFLDTGMLVEEYGGRASALEIRDGKLTAYYADGEPKALRRATAPMPAARPVAHAQRKL